MLKPNPHEPLGVAIQNFLSTPEGLQVLQDAIKASEAERVRLEEVQKIKPEDVERAGLETEK